MTLMTQSQFARAVGVAPQTVGRWIKRGRLDGKALVSTPAGRRIRPDEARNQLAHRLDVDHRRNGRGADVGPPTPLEIALKAARLERIELQNRRLAAVEQAQRRRYCLASDVEAAKAKLAAEMVAAWDTILLELADGQAAEFGLPQGAVRDLFRRIGEKARSEARRAGRW